MWHAPRRRSGTQEEPCRRPAEMLATRSARGLVLFRARGIEVESGRHCEGALGSRLAGLVTNDTFAPLRALATRPRRPPRGRRAPPTVTAGRWSSSRSCLEAERDREAPRPHAGLSRPTRNRVTGVAGDRAQLGGFGAIYPVLREMEAGDPPGPLRRGRDSATRVPGAVDGCAPARHAGGVARGPARRADPASPTAPNSMAGVSGQAARAVGASWSWSTVSRPFSSIAAASACSPSKRPQGRGADRAEPRTLAIPLPSRQGTRRVRRSTGEAAVSIADLFPRAGFRRLRFEPSAAWPLSVPRVGADNVRWRHRRVVVCVEIEFVRRSGAVL